MATGEAPVVAVPKPPKWKFVFFKAAGYAAGITVALVICVGIVVWWSERPKPPKPWNQTAFKSRLWNITLNDVDQTVTLRFELTNNTNEDYQIASQSEVNVQANANGALIGFDRFVTILTPVFIPAHRSGVIALETKIHYKGLPFDNADKDKSREILLNYMKDKYPQLSGFSLFDSANRYEIDCSTDWNKLTKAESNSEPPQSNRK